MSSRKFVSRYFHLLFIFIAFGFLTVPAQNKEKFTKTVSGSAIASVPERETIENIIRTYLIKNPQIIRETLQELQAKEEQEKTQAAAANLKSFESQIYKDETSPFVGNKTGDVPIVVFYDYLCGYCRKSLPDLQNLIAKDPGIKVIYKEFPILSPQSHFAALAALAAQRQGKFVEFHQALFTSDGATSENGIKEIAGRVGLNWEVLQKDMTDPKLSEAIERNIKLAASLNVKGTPAYIIGDQIVPGAIGSADLEKILAVQRAKSRSTIDYER